MSKSKAPTTDTVVGMFQVPGTRNYLIVGFASLLVYFLLMGARGSETGALVALLLAVPGLLARWVMSPVAVLMLTTYLLIDPNVMGLIGLVDEFLGYSGGRGYSGPDRSGWGLTAAVEDLLLAAALMGYLMSQYRLQTLVLRSTPDEPRPRRAGSPPPRPVTRPAEQVTDAELGNMLAAGAACVAGGLVAWIVLRGLEAALRVERSLHITAEGARFLVFVWVLGAGLLIARAVLGYKADRRMRPEEARMVIQDAFWSETRREQERIYRWGNWYRKRREAASGG